MVSWVWLVLAIIIVAAVAAGLWHYMQRRRSVTLRQRFGSEYDRTVQERGRKAGELELEQRKARVESLSIRPLTREEQDHFAVSWRAVQARFVDDPSGATYEADTLITDLMKTRGYPVGDVNQRIADLSVEHSRALGQYRDAHAISERHRRGEATTEDLRGAMVHYRALFEEMLGQRVQVAGRAPEGSYE